jgi:hypothetical protein
MSEGMAADRFDQVPLLSGSSNGRLPGSFGIVMPLDGLTAWIF